MPSGEISYQRGPHYRVILVVDVEESTRRTDSGRARMRQVVPDLLERALRAGGVGPDLRDPFEDRGDGVLVLLYPDDTVPKTTVLGTVVRCLAGLLAHHNARRSDDILRLRVVIHAGEIGYDTGPFGEALDVATRLLDADEAKETLRGVAAPLVLVISDEIFNTVVRHGYDGIDPASFSPMRARDVGGRPCRGRIRPVNAIAPEPAAVRPDHHLNGDDGGRPSAAPSRPR